MCGIAGILSLSPEARVENAALRTMADQLRHRGPDDAGFYLDPQARCGFAFRRLSIIDLKTGNQPLSNEDGTIWTVLNGEIYNYRELRAELVSLGHKFATQSDTETIVHLYEQHGRACFERLSGMLPSPSGTSRARLLLARDHGQEAWCTPLRRAAFLRARPALLALPDTAPARSAVVASLPDYQSSPPHSIYQLQKVLPSHYELFEAGARAGGVAGPRPRNYRCGQAFWRAGSPPRRQLRRSKARLGELLTDAVAARLISDVPLGAFLSGGIDSSIVVGLMRKLGVSPLRTFSIGFADARYDETPYARRIAQLFATEHHEYTVTPQAREVLDTLAWHYDEPFADSSAIPTYYLSRWTRESVTVALTGDAGDECFAGYDRYRAAQLAGSLDRLPHGNGAGWLLAAIVPHGQPGRTPALPFSPRLFPAPRLFVTWIESTSSHPRCCLRLSTEFTPTRP